LANEKNNRTNNNRRRNVKGRNDRYVEEFRWGFVHGEEPEDKTEDEISEKIPAVSRPEKSKKNVVPPVIPKPIPVKKEREQQVRKQVQPKTSSRPAKPADTDDFSADNFSDDDLNLPSYGRTPVPRSSKKLPAVSVPSDNTPSYNAPPDKPSAQSARPRHLQDTPRKDIPPKDAPKQSTSQRVPQRTHQRTESKFPPVQSAAFKEQMVWDFEKRDYVPLTVSKKQPEPVKQTVRQKPFVERIEKPTEKPAEKAAEKPAVKISTGRPAKYPVKGTTARELPAKDIKKPAIPAVINKKTDEDRNRRQRRANIPPMSGSAVTGEKPDAGNIEVEASGFVKLGISDTMLEALKLLRFVEPTPIQAGVFEQVKSGLDVMGQAQTGTGKTAAFCIPIIEAIEECPPGDDPVAMILVPTRELAVQVRDDAVKLAYGREIRITACYGGKPLAKQIERLKNGIDLIIGTPGRILDLVNRRALSFDSLRWVVLDEADRMLDIGFRPDIEKIFRRTPKEKQTLLFSATLAPPVVRLAEKYMKEPVVLDFSNKNIAVETIEQFYITVDPQRKFDALVHLLKEQEPRQAIIFTRTKRGADRLARLLAGRFENLAAIHGDLSQDVRDAVMGKFRSGKVRYLVATDVVGRGIDVSGISHIINYDIPAFCDDYVHRVGRTGRMGREGIAFTFVTVAEGSELTRIEMRINKLLKRAELKGFEAFEKPTATEAELAEEDAPETEPPKPVFGKKVRKVRRAL
jgi:ATP-dependent RNA helicase DeaD